MKEAQAFVLLIHATLLTVLLPIVGGTVASQNVNSFLKGHGSVVQPMIVGGKESKQHAFPYQAAIFIKVPNSDDTLFCGGSLISEDFVLSAAHCLSGAEKVLVILGAHNLNEISDEPPQQIRLSKDLIVHEKWNPNNFKNDIALVKLPEKAILSDSVQTITLPKLSDANKSFCLRLGTVSGWGRASDRATYLSSILRYTQSRIASHLICTLAYFGNVGSDQICMDGILGKSPCNGDSGGPLTLEEKGKPVQQGIVSFGIALGCQVGYPSVFTKVGSYLRWINSKTGIPIRN